MKMASLNKVALESDDEEDVESLRLAALKSLKPKIVNETQNKPPGNSHCKPHLSYNKPSTFGAAQTTRHHNRGFRNNGRTGRNGMNPRIRTNTNLISIQTIDQDEPKEAVQIPFETPKLILPQDRYHKSQANEDMQRENTSNKFDRYDNSEDSESDSEDLAMKSSSRERKGSVELLMDQLENEINLLDAKPDQKPNEDDRLSDSNKLESEEIQNDTLIISDPDIVQIDEPCSPDKIEKPAILDAPVVSKKSRSHSPYTENHSQKRKSLTKSRSRSPIMTVYKSPYRSPPRKVRYSPPYSAPLSPLSLNAEVLNTITMAPLSPRSAAFVLQNRQILARRQMSPRRSRSRESSCRRSLTPKRNKSPRRRSRSPIKRPLSPRMSPKRRSNSPRSNHYRRSPYKSTKRNSHSPIMTNKSIHKRLGSRPNSRNDSPHAERKVEASLKRKRSSRSMSLSLSPSPDRNYHKRPLNETTGHVNNDRNRREKTKRENPKEEPKSIDDPILEARRRKFQSPLQINNGIIKLKSNKPEEDNKEDLVDKQNIEESPKEKDFEDEMEETEEILDLNPTLEDLWSDEESDDDENEGRFKSKPSSEKSVSIIPFRKLTVRRIPNCLVSRDANDRRERRTKRQRRKRSRSPVKTTNKTESKKEFENKEHVDVKLKTSERIRTKTTEEEKKRDKHLITVKSDTNKNTDTSKISHSEKSVKRKVKIQVPDATDCNLENTIEPDIIIENEDEILTSKEDDGGDLRAELSRRRAQRLIKAGSLAEALPARLLKNALQEVVPKRSPIKNTNGCGNSADRRVLILKRLATSPTSQLEPATKVTNKGGKLPIHMRLGSNPDKDEPVRPERRNRKAKSGRRKKQVQV